MCLCVCVCVCVCVGGSPTLLGRMSSHHLDFAERGRDMDGVGAGGREREGGEWEGHVERGGVCV